MPIIPSREDDLARPRARKGGDVAPVTKVEVLEPSVTIPSPDPEWCPAAMQMWAAALESPVSKFYESVDWAYLSMLLDQLTHLYQQGGRRSPELLRVISQGLGSLLFTEGDRRRLRIEIERVEAEPDYSAALASIFTRAIEQ